MSFRLAGHYPRTRGAISANIEPATPQYRWTLKTWIERTWRDWDRSSRADIVQERTVTVTASTEAEAKRKIEAALPSPPALRDSYDYRGEHHERFWSAEGAIEEVVA